MGFKSYNTAQHCCYVSDALASPIQALHKSLSFSSRFSGNQEVTWDAPPFSMGQLSKWRVTSISEWQSRCSQLAPIRKTGIVPSQEDIFAMTDLRNPASTCRCSATHLCGPYLVVELSRVCGCFQSVQIRVNAYSERFVFLDGVALPFPVSSEGTDSSSEDDSSVDWPSTSARLSESDSPSSTFPPSPASEHTTPSSSGSKSPSEDFIKYFQFPVISKRFSLVDLALLLNAIQQEHADHRWTDSYADRSLIEFTSVEVFAFLDYFLELDWRNQVLEYRRSIAKKFYDKRVMAWNTWIPNPPGNKFIGEGELLSFVLSLPQPPGPKDPDDHGSQNQAQDLDHERRLLSCMKDRVSFVNDELRLLWMSLAAQKCALAASKMYLDEGERSAV